MGFGARQEGLGAGDIYAPEGGGAVGEERARACGVEDYTGLAALDDIIYKWAVGYVALDVGDYEGGWGLGNNEVEDIDVRAVAVVG